MSNRRIIMLMLIGIFILAGIEFTLSHRGVSAPTVRRRLSLIELEAPVASIAIERQGAPKVKLTFDERWQIVAPYHGNVHAPAVLKLIDALTLSPVSERISDSELVKIGRDRTDFSLSEPHLKVTLTTRNGTSSVVGFGKPTPAADGVYAAVDGEDAVSIVPLDVFEAADVDGDSLRLRELFDLKVDSVQEMSFRKGNQSPVAFARETACWRCGGSPASADKIRRYLETLVAVQAQSFIWPIGASNETERASESLLASYGLDAENALTVTLKGSDGRERRLALGKEAAAGSVYALAQGGTVVVTVPAALQAETAQDPNRFTDLRLFPVEMAKVSAFTILDGTTAYTLVRGDSDAWRLESPIVAEADAETVKAMLERIAKLQTSDVDPNGISVSLSAASAPIKVAAKAVLPREGLQTLRARRVLNVDGEAIKRLVRTASDKRVEPMAVVYSRERKVWQVEKPEGRGEVDEEAIGKVVKALLGLKAESIVKLKVAAADLDDYGLDAPEFTIAIDQDREGAVRRNLILGKSTRGGRYATVGSTDAVFVISEEQALQVVLPLVRGL